MDDEVAGEEADPGVEAVGVLVGQRPDHDLDVVDAPAGQAVQVAVGQGAAGAAGPEARATAIDSSSASGSRPLPSPLVSWAG